MESRRLRRAGAVRPVCDRARAADPDTFKIGGVVSLSGTYGIFGEDMRKGVTIAIEQRGGKVLGKPIQVTWEDDETKPQPAVQKTTRLISDGSQMIFGAVSSASTLAIMNIAKQRKIPHLVTMSADDKITVPGGSRYTFRTSNTLGMEQRMALAYSKEQKLKRIYGVTADYQPRATAGTGTGAKPRRPASRSWAPTSRRWATATIPQSPTRSRAPTPTAWRCS